MSARQMFHIWPSSNTALVPVSVVQRFGYLGNVNLNGSISVELLMGFWMLVPQVSI